MKLTPHQWDLLFGCFLVLVMAGLAIGIALGQVEEKTSFGLQIILGSLATIVGAWSQRVFGGKDGGDDQKS